MRDSDSNAGSTVSRGTLALGLIAAVEAVVIVVVLVLMTSEPEPSTGARMPSPPDADVAPSFDVPGASDAPNDQTRADHARALPRRMESSDSPQPIVSPHAESDPVGILLCGTVAAENGHAIEGSDCRLRLSDSDVRIGVNHGAYAVGGLEPGPLKVTCSAEGYLSETASIELDAARPIERLDFLLASAPCVPVSLRAPDGRPLLQVLKQAKVPGRFRPIATVEPLTRDLPDDSLVISDWTLFTELESPSGEDAEWHARGFDGVLRLSVPLPVHVGAGWGGQVVASERVVEDRVGVTFTLPVDAFLNELCAVRVRIVDATDRRPLSGALGQLDNISFIPCDDSGSLLFERVPPGKHRLFVHPPGSWQGQSGFFMFPNLAEAAYDEADVALELAAGQQLDLGELPLQLTFAVRGRITDATGRPIAVEVTADRVDPSRDPALPQRSLRARVDETAGSFVLRLAPGRWDLRAGVDRSAAAPTLVDVRGDVDDVHVVGVGFPLK